MNDKMKIFILFGILLCLIYICFKPFNVKQELQSPPLPSVNFSNDFISISPGIVGIKDNGSHTGNSGQLLVFEYDLDSKTFKYTGVLNYEEFMNHPEKYGIPSK